MDLIKKAANIAEKDLRACFTDRGIVAGTHHFVDFWARDSLFATFGTNLINDYQLTIKTIETFFKFQQSDGLLPYLILRASSNVSKYLGKPRYFQKPKAKYRSNQSLGLVLDGGLMTIIAFANYIETRRDKKFLIKWYGRLNKTIIWYQKRFKENLLQEWPLCSWADSVLKLGKTLYSNILYWKALKGISYLAKIIGDDQKETRYKNLAHKIKEEINKNFWNGSYYSDWIDYKRQDYFSTHENLLAIVFGFTNKQQSYSIIKFIKDNCLEKFSIKSIHPKYPWWRIPLYYYLIDLADYHNGLCWLQPEILYSISLSKLNKKNRAMAVLRNISRKIVKYGHVYEVYEEDGRPVKRLFYKSEGPFAWSAGLFLVAVDLISHI